MWYYVSVDFEQRENIFGCVSLFACLEECMAQEFAKAFYASAAWKKCRQGYIDHRRSVDGGMCEVCRENLGFIVHHLKEITPRTLNDPRITLSWDNLEYVCKPCHDKIHDYCGRSQESGRRVVFDAAGEPSLDAPLCEGRPADFFTPVRKSTSAG
jgi:hypothetical protein